MESQINNLFKQFLQKIEHPSFFVEKNAFLIAVVTNLLFVLLALLSCSLSYMTNDDIGIMAIIGGKIGGVTASEYTIEINILLAKVIKQLYMWQPTIPWYESYLVTSLWLSHVAFLFIGLKNRPSIKSWLLFAFYFLLIGIYAFLSLQYTIVAAFLSIAGIGLIVFTKPAQDSKKMWMVYGAGILLIILSSMIRWEAMLMAYALFIPMYILQFLTSTSKKYTILKAIPLLLAAVGCFMLYSYNYSQHEQSREWSKFLEYNRLRSDLADNKPLTSLYVNEKLQMLRKIGWLGGLSVAEQSKILEKVGWSVNDYQMMLNWFWLDEEVYNIAKMTQLVANIPTLKNSEHISSNNIYTFFTTLFTSLFGKTCLLFSLICLLFLRFTIDNLLKVVLPYCIIIFLIVYLMFAERTPPARVYGPMLVFATLTSYWLINQKNALSVLNFSKIRSIIGGLLLFCLLIAVFFNVKNINNQSKRYEYRYEWLKKAVKDLKFLSHAVFVDWGGAFPSEFILPFQDHTFLQKMNLFSLGWGQTTPVAKKQLQNWKIDNLYTAIATDSRVYVMLKKKRWKRVEYLRTYLKEHFSMETKASLLFSNEKFNIYNIDLVKNE